MKTWVAIMRHISCRIQNIAYKNDEYLWKQSFNEANTEVRNRQTYNYTCGCKHSSFSDGQNKYKENH